MRIALLTFAWLVGGTACFVFNGGGDDDGDELTEGRNAGECSDAADNDGDGLFDCDDPNCDGSPDCEEDAVDTDDDRELNGSFNPSQLLIESGEGEYYSTEVFLYNEGDTVEVQSFGISGDEAFWAESELRLPAELAPGEQMYFLVEAGGMGFGVYYGTLTIQTDLGSLEYEMQLVVE